MKVAALPENESERLQALAEYEVLDTPPDPLVDGITELAARICDAPIALVSLLDHERQWFMSNYGFPGIRQTPREISFCSHVVLGDSLLEVPDASKDFRFHDNPLVVGDTRIRFYAGVPLRDPRGFRLGTLCVMDRIPRTLTDSQRRALADLSHRLIELLDERKAARGLLGGDRLELTGGTSVGIWEWDIRSSQLYVSPRVSRLLGYAAGARGCDFIGWAELVHPDDRARVAAVINRARTAADEWFDAGFRLKHKSGAYVKVRLRGLTLRDEGARPVRMAGPVIDIGALKQAEVVVDTVGRDSESTLVRANRKLRQQLRLFRVLLAERKRQQEQIERQARVLRMQSGVNSAVLHITNRDELLQEACRLATEVGGYNHATFSVVANGGRHAIPRFRAGDGSVLPEPAIIEIGDGTAPDTSLSGRALRTRKIEVCGDLRQSEPPVAMRERAIELGYRSMVALPLIVDGRPVAVLMLISRDAGLVRDAELLGYLQQMMASLSFALRSQQHADTVQFLACYDQLTGLAKRSLFCERVQQVLQDNVVLNNRLAVVAFDVRNLSNLNDTFGRQCGDLVLQKIAERFKHFARSDEDTGYLGGGTFVLLEPQLAGGDESMRSLLEASVFGDPVEIEGRTIRLSCCCGIARYPEDGIDSGTLVQRAEAALKHAKESGEQYLHYKLEMHSQIAERLELEHKLRVAIDEQQFELYYQPQVHLESGRVESVEALLRWNDPATGVVEPARFLEVLEASGMIVQVGHWVLNQAVRDCERWAQMGIAPLRVAVNVSAVQLRQRAFVRDALDVSKRLSAHVGFGIDLEITETAVLHDIEGVSQKLRELRAAGFRIALDDFGTGYSSLGLLSKLPVDLLKIDRSFVNGLPDDAACMALVESITRLASSFQLTTVVEGVETEAQLETLRAMRCSHWQGFLMSPPLPAAQIERLLTRA